MKGLDEEAALQLKESLQILKQSDKQSSVLVNSKTIRLPDLRTEEFRLRASI